MRISLRRNRRGEVKGARITEILERSHTTYVGSLQKSRGYAFFVTNNKELRQDIFIPDDKCLNATSRDKVVVRILDWDAHAKNPRGEVIDVLGRAGENTAEMMPSSPSMAYPTSTPRR